ncbi:hypothetical protein P7L94_23810, partial [Vibrio parahaemolyticus]|nr:hypothetical protein [Vibrio parahaemolyticus]
MGIKAANGVVLATEKKQKSILYDERSVHKVEPITKHIGLVYSGMGPDYRVLVHRARKLAQQYYLVYQEPIPTAQLVQRVASVMQEYTQSGGVRPFGVSLLICGWNEGRPYLFQSDKGRRVSSHNKCRLMVKCRQYLSGVPSTIILFQLQSYSFDNGYKSPPPNTSKE